ncbi:hypothetical protein Tco_0835972 [Tanacetum coccineum]
MSEGLKHGIEHGKAGRDLAAVEAYDLEGDSKVIPRKMPPSGSAFKEEMLLEDAIVANISQAGKRKKCRVVCRTHGIGSAHHARSEGILVSVPTITPQGLAILLADAAAQTEVVDKEDEPHPRL